MDNVIKCETCEKDFKSLAGMRSHARVHGENKQTTIPETKFETKTVNVPVMAPPTRTLVAEHQAKIEPVLNTKKWLELPEPLQEHLKLVFGNWLNYFEVGQVWKPDFGGYGMYIIVPKEYSTEWQELEAPVYDNVTMKMVGKNQQVIKDIRWKPIKEISDVKNWIDQVKRHVMENCYRRGIRLPSTNTGSDEAKQTLEEYQMAIAGQKQPIY